MDTKKLDYSNLIVQAFMRFDESYAKIKERYKSFPLRLIECINRDECSECPERIRVDFNNDGACITYIFDKNRMPLYTCISFYDSSYESLFISYVKRLAQNYDDLKQLWFLTDSFYIEAIKSCVGTEFYCFRQ